MCEWTHDVQSVRQEEMRNTTPQPLDESVRYCHIVVARHSQLCANSR
jgi:hypothetical protein